jgi:hypothetical protein
LVIEKQSGILQNHGKQTHAKSHPGRVLASPLNSCPGPLRQAGNRLQTSTGNISIWYFKKGIEWCQLQIAFSQADVLLKTNVTESALSVTL